MNAELRRLVRERAGDCCEYCGISQQEEGWSRFHVEHIVARQHKGGDSPDNLCLCCQYCNLHKGPNLSGVDPVTGVITRLFHPRQDVWDEHFIATGLEVIGRTAPGRATVEVLAMNSPKRIEFRHRLRGDD
jgi:hypothetical protein